MNYLIDYIEKILGNKKKIFIKLQLNCLNKINKQKLIMIKRKVYLDHEMKLLIIYIVIIS